MMSINWLHTSEINTKLTSLRLGFLPCLPTFTMVKELSLRMNAGLPLRMESWELGNLTCRPNSHLRITGTSEGSFPSENLRLVRASEETYIRFCACETVSIKKKETSWHSDFEGHWRKFGQSNLCWRKPYTEGSHCHWTLGSVARAHLG